MSTDGMSNRLEHSRHVALTANGGTDACAVVVDPLAIGDAVKLVALAAVAETQPVRGRQHHLHEHLRCGPNTRRPSASEHP